VKLFNAPPDQREEVEAQLERSRKELRSNLEAYLNFLEAFIKELEKKSDEFNPAPGQFQYKGFRVYNPDGLNENDALGMLDKVSFAMALFKKRDLEDLIREGINYIELKRSEPGDGTLGIYDSEQSRVVLYSVILKVPERHAKGWVHNTFIHEFGHHIHLNYLTREAKAFWDSTWAPVTEALEKSSRKFNITSNDRRQFMVLLKRSNYDPLRVFRSLAGADKIRFASWMYRSQVLEDKVPLRVSPLGKEILNFLQDPHKHATVGLLMTGQIQQKDIYTRPAQDLIAQVVDKLQDLYDKALGIGRHDRGTVEVVSIVGDGVKSDSLVGNLFSRDPETREAFKDFMSGADYQSAIEDVAGEWGTPTEYGKTDMMEDFAESFLVFMVAPHKMTEKNLYRMKRTLWLSGFGGKPVMRLARREIVRQILRKKADVDFETFFMTWARTAVKVLERWTLTKWAAVDFERGMGDEGVWVIFNLIPRQPFIDPASRLHHLYVEVFQSEHPGYYGVTVTGEYTRGPAGYGSLAWFSGNFEFKKPVRAAVEQALSFAKQYGLGITYDEAKKKPRLR
jgi:hypothetical protein